jgi:hypothetical protein
MKRDREREREKLQSDSRVKKRESTASICGSSILLADGKSYLPEVTKFGIVRMIHHIPEAHKQNSNLSTVSIGTDRTTTLDTIIHVNISFKQR